MRTISLLAAWMFLAMLAVPVLCGSLAHHRVVPRLLGRAAAHPATISILSLYARVYQHWHPVLCRWRLRVVTAIFQISIVGWALPFYFLPGLPFEEFIVLEGESPHFGRIVLLYGTLFLANIGIIGAGSWFRRRGLDVPDTTWTLRIMLSHVFIIVAILLWPALKDVPLY